MEEEMQQLREQLAQLEADNERLRQERAAPQAGPAGAFHAPNVSSDQARSLGSRTPSTERVFVMARDRKCPLFNGVVEVNAISATTPPQVTDDLMQVTSLRT
uniref:Uncharacterized protein n=1 Tax=Knipowitschia caucasica TaxID=637954 RepID=A0AAV2MGM4_KNICA